MGLGETSDCPVCGEHKCLDVDGVWQCSGCGTYETWEKDGLIWTHVKAPIGRIKLQEK